jgi:rhodanese-related sulfurtransferase
MASTLLRITRESLWDMIQNGETFVLVDALAPMSYASSHLPGAINIPPEAVDDRAPRSIADRDTQVVVYCMNEACDSSELVADRLIELGYRNVRRYPEGKSDWADAGLPLEGGRV